MWRRPERLPQREAVHQLAGAGPHQRTKRRQNPEASNAKGGEPRRHGVPQRSHHTAEKPKLPVRAIPQPASWRVCSTGSARTDSSTSIKGPNTMKRSIANSRSGFWPKKRKGWDFNLLLLRRLSQRYKVSGESDTVLESVFATDTNPVCLCLIFQHLTLASVLLIRRALGGRYNS